MLAPAPTPLRTAAPWFLLLRWCPAVGMFQVMPGGSGQSLWYQSFDRLSEWLTAELAGRTILAAWPVPAFQGSEDGPFLIVIASS